MEIKKVAIIGCGTMGAGIAQWFLQQNVVVDLIDQNHELLKTTAAKIIHNLENLASKGKITENDSKTFKLNLRITTLQDIHQDCNLVIEAIVENLEIKRKVFHELDLLLSDKTIFASNTSSIPITEISSALPLARRQLFFGIHFFNPATIMKLVEVINGVDSDAKTSDLIVEYFNSKGKTAVLCADRPGFIVNRVARNFYGESLRIVENYNIEKIKEVDQVLKIVGGFKMGPFELMDLIGIDINLAVTESVYKSFFDEARFRPHKLQREMVMAQRLGVKTKKGFYEY